MSASSLLFLKIRYAREWEISWESHGNGNSHVAHNVSGNRNNAAGMGIVS